MSLYIMLTLGFLALLFSTGYDNEDQPKSIGRSFHSQTSFGDSGYKGKPAYGKQQPSQKPIDEKQPRFHLVPPSQPNISLVETIHKRRSVRDFLSEPLDQAKVSAILFAAYGVINKRGGFNHHTVPSGGGLYPMQIYLAVSNVSGLEPGLYMYSEVDSLLVKIKDGDLSKQLHHASHEQGSVGNSPATLIITSRFERMTHKYADRGYRYLYIEAGAICQNIYLTAASLGLGTVAVGAFNDDRLNQLLDIDGVHEAALLIMPIGEPE